MAPVFLFVPAEAARDKLFVRDLVKFFPREAEPVFLFHETGVPNPELALMVAKRWSGLLSEDMIGNTLLAGDQRGVLRVGPTGDLHLNTDAVANQLKLAPHVVVPPIGATPEGKRVKVDAVELLKTYRKAFPAAIILLFPSNPQSALVHQPDHFPSLASIDQKEALFPEEATVFAAARQLIPCFVGAPHQLGQVIELASH